MGLFLAVHVGLRKYVTVGAVLPRYAVLQAADGAGPHS